MALPGEGSERRYPGWTGNRRTWELEGSRLQDEQMGNVLRKMTEKEALWTWVEV